jgi:hypothetical protein
MTAVNVLQARERTENRIESYPMGQEKVSISLEFGEFSASRIVSERAKCDKMRLEPGIRGEGSGPRENLLCWLRGMDDL